MYPEVQIQLKELAMLCSTVFLGEHEWRRLSEIAVCIHTNGGLQDHKVVKHVLLQHGCTLQKAGFLSRQILHLCTVLQMYDERRNKSAKESSNVKEMIHHG
jgi:hypothetical protein